MAKEPKPSQPRDLTKGSSRKTAPELSESDLNKVSGGVFKIDGESMDDKHKGEIG